LYAEADAVGLALATSPLVAGATLRAGPWAFGLAPRAASSVAFFLRRASTPSKRFAAWSRKGASSIGLASRMRSGVQ
jgi:hypothetical protein